MIYLVFVCEVSAWQMARGTDAARVRIYTLTLTVMGSHLESETAKKECSLAQQ